MNQTLEGKVNSKALVETVEKPKYLKIVRTGPTVRYEFGNSCCGYEGLLAFFQQAIDPSKPAEFIYCPKTEGPNLRSVFPVYQSLRREGSKWGLDEAGIGKQVMKTKDGKPYLSLIYTPPTNSASYDKTA